MSVILGYWIESEDAIYFVRGPQDALPQHKEVFEKALKGVTLTTVTEYKDIAHYVILRHMAKDIYIYTRWTPNVPRPLEHDHTGKVAFEVVDFAENIAEAEAVVKQLKSQK